MTTAAIPTDLHQEDAINSKVSGRAIQPLRLKGQQQALTSEYALEVFPKCHAKQQSNQTKIMAIAGAELIAEPCLLSNKSSAEDSYMSIVYDHKATAKSQVAILVLTWKLIVHELNSPPTGISLL